MYKSKLRAGPEAGDDFLWNLAPPVVEVLIHQAPHEGRQGVAVVGQRQLGVPLKLLRDVVELHRVLGEQSYPNARPGMRELHCVCVYVPRVAHAPFSYTHPTRPTNQKMENSVAGSSATKKKQKHIVTAVER